MKGSRGWEQLPTTGSNGGNGKSKGVGKPVPPPPPAAGTTPLPPPPPAVAAPPSSSSSNSNADGATCAAVLEAYVSNLTDMDRATHRAAFLEFTVSCIGAKVDATLTNGAVVTGYFNTQTADLTVVLKATTTTTTTTTGRRGHDAGPAGSDDPAEAGPVAVTGATQVILPDALATLGVPAASLRVARGGAAAGHELPTDGAIPRGRDLQHLHGRQLQAASAWLDPSTSTSLETPASTPSSSSSAPSSSSSSSSQGGTKAWDQFEANKRLFNVKSTYDENLYTKKLDLSKMTKEQIKRAEKMAREIEGSATDNQHLREERGHAIEREVDEEDLYSGVVRDGGAAWEGDGADKPGKGRDKNGHKDKGGPGAVKGKGPGDPAQSAPPGKAPKGDGKKEKGPRGGPPPPPVPPPTAPSYAAVAAPEAPDAATARQPGGPDGDGNHGEHGEHGEHGDGGDDDGAAGSDPGDGRDRRDTRESFRLSASAREFTPHFVVPAVGAPGGQGALPPGPPLMPPMPPPSGPAVPQMMPLPLGMGMAAHMLPGQYPGPGHLMTYPVQMVPPHMYPTAMAGGLGPGYYPHMMAGPHGLPPGGYRPQPPPGAGPADGERASEPSAGHGDAAADEAPTSAAGTRSSSSGSSNGNGNGNGRDGGASDDGPQRPPGTDAEGKNGANHATSSPSPPPPPPADTAADADGAGAGAGAGTGEAGADAPRAPSMYPPPPPPPPPPMPMYPMPGAPQGLAFYPPQLIGHSGQPLQHPTGGMPGGMPGAPMQMQMPPYMAGAVPMMPGHPAQHPHPMMMVGPYGQVYMGMPYGMPPPRGAAPMMMGLGPGGPGGPGNAQQSPARASHHNGNGGRGNRRGGRHHNGDRDRDRDHRGQNWGGPGGAGGNMGTGGGEQPPRAPTPGQDGGPGDSCNSP